VSAELDGKVAIVTGASSGIGRRFASVLHDAGATVIAAARRMDRLEQLAASAGDRMVPMRCDLSVDSDREQLVREVNERFGTIDVLVNNAGMTNVAPAEEETLEAIRSVLEVNLVAVFHLSQLVGRIMLEKGTGAIVNVGSMLGTLASSPINEASYCASKGAVANLTRELSAQWARKGVRVNNIAPGWFETEMTHLMWEDESSSRWVKRNTPVGRPGTETELDGVLLLLAGAGGSFIHGQTIVVDGGWSIH
jgi:NAD(P)-dependent dehydrogenase (short-subunit alcohol dehydrogenase family)